MDLFILRHGEAGERSSSLAGDRKRPLTSSGKLEISEIAKALKIIGLKFDMVITSPLKRAYDTATIVSEVLKIGNKVQVWKELTPEGQKTELYRKHQPLLGEMTNDMIQRGKSSPCNLLLKKGGIVRIRLKTRNSVPKGELRWLLTPRILKSICKKGVK
jgi:phosphohistidine phosphatase